MTRTNRAVAALLLAALYAYSAAGSKVPTGAQTEADTEAPEATAAYQILVFNNTRPAAPAKIGAAVEQMKQALGTYLFWAESADQVSLYSVDFSKPNAKAVFQASGPTARGKAQDVLTNCQNIYVLLFDKTLSANLAKELHKAIEQLWPGQSVGLIQKKTPQCTDAEPE